MARYPAAQRSETHRKILGAAGRLFRTAGYSGAGVAKVMGEAGLTVGGFYAHFASKESLLTEVLAESLNQTRGVFLAGLEDLEGGAFIREVARRYLSRLHRDMPADGCALPALVPDIGRQSGETKAEFEEYLNRLLDGFEDRMPEPNSEITRRDRAIALMVLLVGGIAFARAVNSAALSDRILLACKRFAEVQT